MSVLVAPNFNKQPKFGCDIFQTFDVLTHIKLSVVRLRAENRLAVLNFKTIISRMDKYYVKWWC